MTFQGRCARVNGKQLKHITLYFPESIASYTSHPALSHLHAHKDYSDSDKHHGSTKSILCFCCFMSLNVSFLINTHLWHSL